MCGGNIMLTKGKTDWSYVCSGVFIQEPDIKYQIDYFIKGEVGGVSNERSICNK